MTLLKKLTVTLLTGLMTVACSGPVGSSGASGNGTGDGNGNGNGSNIDSGAPSPSDGGTTNTTDAPPTNWPVSSPDAGSSTTDAGGWDSGFGGFDAGFDAGPSCHGTPTPCDLLTSCTTAGCTSTGGGCTGVSTACFEIFSSFTCGTQLGCYWDSTSNTCSGVSATCGGVINCTLQQGCSVSTASCTGVPAVKCELAGTLAECGTISGCFWY